MTSAATHEREQFLERLRALIEERSAEDRRSAMLELAHHFHAHRPPEDFVDRNVEDVYGALISVRRLLGRRDDATPVVQVFNPELDRDGWSSRHTVAQIHQVDSPFVVDSFLMALGRFELTLHALHNMVLGVRRDDEGNSVELDPEGREELVIHAEIDRLDPGEFEAFREDLVETLADVRVTVEDFRPMCDRVRALMEELAPVDSLQAAAPSTTNGEDHDAALTAGPPAEALRDELERSPPAGADGEIAEARAFLAWLLDDNFTFLGYRRFTIDGGADDAVMREVPDSTLGVLRRRDRPATPRRLAELAASTRAFVLEPGLLQFSKGGTRSRVHRPAYPDYVAVKVFDAEGRVVGEHGFLGHYTSPVYQELPSRIPMLRRRVLRLLARSGYDPDGFDGKVMKQVIATFPRDELFQAGEDELLEMVLRVTQNHERNRLQVLIREDRYGMFFSCLVYTPREIYDTRLRERVQQVLCEAFRARDAEFTSYFSESVLIRTHFVLRVDPNERIEWSHADIEARIRALARDFAEALREELVTEFGETRARTVLGRYARAFPSAYRERFDARVAVHDIDHMERLEREGDLNVRLYRQAEDPAEQLRLKVFHCGARLALSDMLPLLENLGVRVLAQHPYRIERADGRRGSLPVSIYDFALAHSAPLDLAAVGELFEEAFLRVWRGEAEDDGFNRLVLAAGVSWREAGVLRAYGGYSKQVRFPFGLDFVIETLLRHAPLAARLLDYFRLRHDPDGEGQGEPERDELLAALDRIPALNEDRILRRYLELIDATLRTNYFRQDAEGRPPRHLALKIAPERLADVPEPRVPFEIYVRSPETEGVHLRGAAIARGGLRWSDRNEDYRTEVLGLVKAQQVKNAVIVPEGAKGGFVVRTPTAHLDRDARQERGRASYTTFIRGLLDVTDNRVGGRVVPPPRVRRHDGDDPYLVVAADKGTATFSDLANAIAAEYDFWLGDAFASGGSHGYDHKRMGITARGAWVSVARHFRERGVDVQHDPVVTVGIGDMSGDVFGNGMLLSRSLRVVAAFDHRHVFVDPDPEPEAAFAERERLFALPRSTWADYDTGLISAGGGVFSRQEKSVPISPEMQRRFELTAERLTPDELIRALLAAPVDLVWNGGIGTYVKASHEGHADVGDKANDGVRIDGRDLRARVIGEGGNLGLTQAGRVEAALNGVAVNTDFIDNSGGVDCSDHEVNLKILLDALVADGDLTERQRNELLAAMTEEVAALVLEDNARQAQALSLAERHARPRLMEYQRFIHRLEDESGLDRQLEGLPDDETFGERRRSGASLTRPELAVLLAHAKIHIKEQLIGSGIAADPRVADFARIEFPATFLERFGDRLGEHYLFEDIVATQVANDLVHHMGPTYVSHLQEYLGGEVEDAVRAWLIVRGAFDLATAHRRIETLQLDATVQLELMEALVRLGRRGGRWFLRHRRGALAVADQVDFFAPRVAELRPTWDSLRAEAPEPTHAPLRSRLTQAGVPEDLVGTAADAGELVAALSIIDVASRCDRDLASTARLWARLAGLLGIGEVAGVVGRLTPRSLWEAMERDALLDDLITMTGTLTERVLAATGETPAEEVPDADAWLAEQGHLTRPWHRVVGEVIHDGEGDFAMYAMAVRKLGDLIGAL